MPNIIVVFLESVETIVEHFSFYVQVTSFPPNNPPSAQNCKKIPPCPTYPLPLLFPPPPPPPSVSPALPGCSPPWRVSGLPGGPSGRSPACGSGHTPPSAPGRRGRGCGLREACKEGRREGGRGGHLVISVSSTIICVIIVSGIICQCQWCQRHLTGVSGITSVSGVNYQCQWSH